jgi:hypothetical protein
MMHNKRISHFTSFQHVISTEHSVHPNRCSLVKDLEGNCGLLSEIHVLLHNPEAEHCVQYMTRLGTRLKTHSSIPD